MTNKPEYFDAIRCKSAKRWQQLEGDPELAGPWHQLFSQVQSPRHVFSELLQNADDANAKNVKAYIHENEFVFEHDGDDFTEEHFYSLCRFGYSNKRNLHTIGFRGIGFKSTFSLGDNVILLTPTVSVAFNKARFTEPVWQEQETNVSNTQIRVKIKDANRQQELKRNLSEWSSSPMSLLFFKSIQSIEIEGESINRHSLGGGPLQNSEWIKLAEDQEVPYLLIRSKEEAFPKDCVNEIRQERMGSESLELPPCQIDIVMASDKEKRLYVVLPTGVETLVPFSCNAPFIQDPARVKIKDPEMSPTNRWLLERAGKLAALSLLAWLNKTDLSLEERSKAYSLFPDVNRELSTLEGVCDRICEEAFEEAIKEKDCLLSQDGQVLSPNEAISVPKILYDIWQPEQIPKLFDEKHRQLISKHISDKNLEKLDTWNLIERITHSQIMDKFQDCH